MARRRRSSARTTPARVEARILANAAQLRDHPEAAAPTCTGSCPMRCPYGRARSDVMRVHAARDDAGALRALSRGGPIWRRIRPIAQGYAALLLLLDEGEIPYMASMKTRAGPVPIVPRGKAPASVHAGLQHFHDPDLRALMAVDELPRGSTLYVTPDGLVCAHDGTPPDGAVDEALKDLPVQRVSPNLARCAHVPDDWTSGAYLELDWRAAGVRVRVCSSCASANTATRLLRRALSRDPAEGVSVRVQLPRLYDPGGGSVPDAQPTLARDDMAQYLRGRMDDAALFERARASRHKMLAALDEPLVVVGDEAFRPQDGLLLERLAVPGHWRAGLQAGLRELPRTAILARPSAAGLLEALWEGHGRAVLDAAGGQGTADELYDPNAGVERLPAILDEAVRRARSKDLEAVLPAYARVPPPADLVDAAVRLRRSDGDGAAIRLLEKEVRAGRRGAAAHAMLRLMGRPGHQFALTHHDQELAEHLAPVLERVLAAEADAYDAALADFLAACGVAERPERR